MFKYIKSDMYYGDDDVLKLDWANDNHGGIPLKQGKNAKGDPYVTKSTDLGGHEVYSVYPYNGDAHVAIFKGLKKGKIGIDDYRDWLNEVAIYIYDHILRQKGMYPDIIAVPASSSSLVEDVAKEIRKVSSGAIDYLSNAFRKNPVDQIVIDIPDKIAEANPTFVKKAQQSFDKMQASGVFEAKSVYKPALKFYRNIYRGEDSYIDQLEDKVVAVLDDSMSSRMTMMSILDVCDNVYHVKDCYGVTVFKRSGTKK